MKKDKKKIAKEAVKKSMGGMGGPFGGKETVKEEKSESITGKYKNLKK